MPIKFPCGFCRKPVAKNHKGICCDSCETWSHKKCSKVSDAEYIRLSEDESTPWKCQNCFNNAVPFSTISNENMKLTNQGKNLIINTILDPSDNLNEQFFNDIKNSPIVNSLETENSCPYTTLSDINQRNQNQNSLNIFHLNIASLNLHQDELKVLLENCNPKFNFIGISKTGYKNNNSTVTIDGFNHSDCFTESKKGGVRLYISSELSFFEKGNFIRKMRLSLSLLK